MDEVEKTQVPPGALPNEVADTVDIKASEGEYIIPANVVRFLGLDKLEKMVEQAKGKLGEMEANGRMGDTGEELPFSVEELMVQEQGPPADPPAFAAGGMVQGTEVVNEEIDPTTGLPTWLTKMQASTTPQTPQATPTTPAPAPRESQGQWQPKGPTGLAGSVDQWTPKDFNTYATARNSIEQKVGQKLASFMPMGGLAVRAREKYLERNVPKELEKMISTGVDLQGNPLDEAQVTQLKDTYSRLSTEPLEKGFGYSSIAKKVAQDAGLLAKPSPEQAAKKAAKQRAENQKDGLVGRAMDAITKDRSTKAEKTSTSKSSSNEAKSSSDRDEASKNTGSKKSTEKDDKSKSR